jgi:hypothetical protein
MDGARDRSRPLVGRTDIGAWMLGQSPRKPFESTRGSRESSLIRTRTM